MYFTGGRKLHGVCKLHDHVFLFLLDINSKYKLIFKVKTAFCTGHTSIDALCCVLFQAKANFGIIITNGQPKNCKVSYRYCKAEVNLITLLHTVKAFQDQNLCSLEKLLIPKLQLVL